MNWSLQDLPEKIKRYRKNRGESQTEFGLRFGVKRLAVANWENRRSTPNVSNLPKLFELLTEQACEGPTHQLLLPFDPPVGVTLKISPRSDDTIHFEIHLKREAS